MSATTPNSNFATDRWPTVQLSEVAEHCLGKMLDARKNRGRPMSYLRNPNVRWFDIDLTDLRTMPFEPHEDERYGLRAGDVLVCEGGEAGRAAIWDGRVPDVKFQKAIHRVRPGPRLDARYLVHQLMRDYQTGRLADYYTGATIKHFTGQDLARYRFPLPPIQVQRRVAGLLDRVESIRGKRRAVLAQLDSLTQSVFLEMFGDPIANPKRWERVPFSILLERIDSGWSPTCLNRPASAQHEWGVLKLGAVTWCEYDSRENKALPPEVDPDPNLEVRVGDILFTRKNTPDLVAACAVVQSTRPKLMISDLIFRFHLMPGAAIDPIFLQRLLTFPTKRRELQQLAGGSAGSMPNISKGKLANAFIELPPLQIQREFARRVEAVQKLKARAHESLVKLDELFMSVQHRAFKGDL
jgi:type I restriction enzyme S subunit